MSFPILGTPKPQFFDSSGSPLVSGTLSILDPADDTNKASYPTADLADAGSTPNSNPITLDSRGEPSSGLFGRNNEDYKVVLKDSTGTTIWTQDDIWLPDAPVSTASRTIAINNGSTVIRGKAPTVTVKEIGNFTTTLTGLTTSPTVLWKYVKQDDIVVMFNQDTETGTSNATTMATDTVVPTAIRPVVDRRCLFPVQDNGTTALGLCTVKSGGWLVFGADLDNPNAGFTNSGTKGLPTYNSPFVFKGYDAWVLYPFMFFRDKREDVSDRLFRHELEHVYQVQREGWFKFYLKYLLYAIRYKYKNIPYEVEARLAEALPLTEKERKLK